MATDMDMASDRLSTHFFAKQMNRKDMDCVVSRVRSAMVLWQHAFLGSLHENPRKDPPGSGPELGGKRYRLRAKFFNSSRSV
jgi:hypothetical protein